MDNGLILIIGFVLIMAILSIAECVMLRREKAEAKRRIGYNGFCYKPTLKGRK